MQTYLQKQENYIRKLTLKLIISITPEEFIFPNVILKIRDKIITDYRGKFHEWRWFGMFSPLFFGIIRSVWL